MAIEQYKELLRGSLNPTERRTIEMWLAKEHDKLREQADVGLPSLQQKIEDAADRH